MQTHALARFTGNRWFNDAAGAAFITLLLFTGLHLATTGHREAGPVNRPMLTDFIFVPRAEPPAAPRRPVLPKRLEQPQATRMAVSAPQRTADLAPGAAGMPAPRGIGLPVNLGPIGLGMGGSGTGDGELIPLVAMAPQYPAAAARDGLEGWVDVEIVIGPDGLVKSARALAANPRGAFESAAVQAAFKSRFRPRTVDGRGVEARGVRRYNFSLGNG